MRLLILLSGILTCGTGAFCFAFYTSTFYDVAFLVGVIMVISGLGHIAAYVFSGKKTRKLSEATLIEGAVTFFYGLSVLSNQVTDSMLTMFFGTWLTVCGIARFSQSIYVSRFNPKDWIKILPLSIIASGFGMIMMLPWLLDSVMPLMLVGGAFILCGLSMLMYAMYMRDSSAEMAEGEARAKARAEAKKAEHEALQEERERVRKLSKSEREKEEKKRRKAQKIADEENKRQKEAARAARKAAARPPEERTVRLEPKEVRQINEAAAAIEAENAAKKAAEEENSAKLTWNRPEAVPSLRASRETVEKKAEPVADTPIIVAVNLEEIEKEVKPIKFETVELPEVKLESDTVKADRDAIIGSLDNFRIDKEEKVEYESVDLEELVSEPMSKKSDPADATRFTQTLNFSWLKQANEDINGKEKI